MWGLSSFPYIAFDFLCQKWYNYNVINLGSSSLFGGGFFVSNVGKGGVTVFRTQSDARKKKEGN